MSIYVLGSFTSALLGWLMAFLSVVLILLVLVQRGKGGGLAGALGGPGGQSAFGSKAGDTFTLITIIMATVWGFTCAFTMWLLGQHAAPVAGDYDTPSMNAGPGDEDVDTGIVTPGATSATSGLSGIGSLESTETPSVELVPKVSTETTAEESSPAETESE